MDGSLYDFSCIQQIFIPEETNSHNICLIEIYEPVAYTLEITCANIHIANVYRLKCFY